MMRTCPLGSFSGGIGPNQSPGTVTIILPLAALARPARCARSVVNASSGLSLSWILCRQHILNTYCKYRGLRPKAALRLRPVWDRLPSFSILRFLSEACLDAAPGQYTLRLSQYHYACSKCQAQKNRCYPGCIIEVQSIHRSSGNS